VEKTDVKNQDLSKEAWVKSTVKKHTAYWGRIKLEETGRYYLVWAAPVIEKDKKGKETVEGAVALKIDLWDCFHNSPILPRPLFWCAWTRWGCIPTNGKTV